MKDAEIEEIIADRIAYAEKESAALLESFHMTDNTVAIGAFCPVWKPKTAYNLKPQKESHLIHSFQSLGWPDPFPS